MKRFLSFVVLLMAICGIVRAQDVETWTYVPNKALGIAGNGKASDVTLSDMAWSMTFDCKTTTQKDSYSGGSNANLQFGTNTAKLKSLTLSTDGFAGKLITKVVVNCTNASNDAAVVLAVSTGTYADSQSLAVKSTTFADYTFEPNELADNLTLKFTNSATKGGLKIHQITVYTQNEPDSRAEVTLQWSVSDVKYSVGEQITPPDLSVTPAEARAEVKFASSNERVVSVAADGALTVVGAGVAIVTASIADSENYLDASASYKVTVIDPNESYFTLVFKESGSSATLVKTTTKPSTIITEGAELVSEFSEIAAVYYSDKSNGLRFSTSSNLGKLTINLLDDYAITRVEAVVTGWSDTESGPLSINGETSEVADGTAAYSYPEVVRRSTIVIESAEKKREFLQSLKVYYSTEPMKETVAVPVFDPAGGEVESGTKVAISCGTEGATIWYAIGDGEFVEYTEPIALTEAVTLHAKATRENMNDSEVATASYTIKMVDLREEAQLSWAQNEVKILLGEEFTGNVLSVTPEAARSEVRFTSSDEGVVTVAADGSLTVAGAGTAAVTASIADSETYKDATASYTVTVTDPNAPEEHAIVILAAGATYGGDVSESYVREFGTVPAEYDGVCKLSLSSYNATAKEFRSNANNTLSLTPEAGVYITKVVFVNSNKEVGTVTLESSDGELTSSGSQWTWNGFANGAVQIKSTKQLQVKYFEVHYQKREVVTLDWQVSEAVHAVLGEAFESPTLWISNEAARAHVVYASDNEAVATVDANGTVAIAGAGTAVISASMSDNNTYAISAPASYRLEVADPNAMETELNASFFKHSQNAYSNASDTDNYGVTYSAVYAYQNSGMAFNTGNSNGRASEIVVSANERMIIESITIEMNSGSVNVYANKEAFMATTKGQKPVVPESAVKLNDEVIAASAMVPVNARAFAIWPAADKAQIKKVTVKYVYVPAPKHDYGATVDAEHNDVFEFAAVENYSLYFRWQEVTAAAGSRAAAVGEWSEYSGDNKPVFDHKRDMVLELKHVADNGAESNTTAIAVHYSGPVTGIGEVEAESGEVEYFDLRGVRVVRPGQGIYLRRQGGVVSKEAVR